MVATRVGGLLLVAALLHTAAVSQDRIIVEHADSLVGTIIDGHEARKLVGHVRIVHGDVRVWCDSAFQFLRTGKVQLEGNVVIKDDSVTLRAPRGLYDQRMRKAEGRDGVVLDDGSVFLSAREGEYFVDEERAFFRGSVLVREKGSTILSDSLTYFRAEKRSIAEGHVRVFDRAQDLMITGKHLDHRTEEGYSRMTGAPFLVQVDSTGRGPTDTLIVRSRIMESFRIGQRRLLAIDSVRIVRRDLSALAGLATFFPEGDSIHLRTDPVVWYDQTQVTGDSINVSMVDRQLDHVDVIGTAFGISRTDTLQYVRYDQLSGDLMVLAFADRRLRKVTLRKRATSVYHLFEDSLANGLNKASGDMILMDFDSGKVASITVVGGVEGEYVPENILFSNEERYRLPGFVWRGDRPFMTPLDVVAIRHARRREE